MKFLKKINLASIYFTIFAVLFTGVLAPFIYIVCPIIGIFSKRTKEKYAHAIAKIWGFFLTTLTFSRFKIDGLENYNPKKTYIITQNHQSAFDIFYSFKMLKGNYCFISKDEYFHFFAIGYAMRNANYVAVKRDSIASLKMIDDSMQRVKSGRSIVIYPEGTRSKDGNIRYPKKGFLKVAERCEDVPILPIVIDGTINIMKPKSLKMRFGNRVRVRFLKPIYPKDMGNTEEERLNYWNNMMKRELEILRK